MKWTSDTHGITDAGREVIIERAALTEESWVIRIDHNTLVGPEGGCFQTREMAQVVATKWIEAAEATSRAVECGPRVVWTTDLQRVREILVERAVTCMDGTAGRYIEAIDLLDALLTTKEGGK